MRKLASFCFASAALLVVTLVGQFAVSATFSVNNATRIYFTDGGQGGFGRPDFPGFIRRVDVDGSNLADILPTDPIVEASKGDDDDDDNSDPRGIVLDQPNGRLFWTDMRGGVFRVNVDGSGAAYVSGVVGDEFATQGIDYNDPSGRVFYHTNTTPNLRSVNADGTGESTVLASDIGGFASGLVVNPAAGHVYWAAGGDIYRSNLDGSSAVPILTSLDPPPRGLALHIPEGRIYFTTGDDGPAEIRRVNMDGTSNQLLHFIGDGTDFFAWGIGLDLANGYIYWTESQLQRIRRSNLDGSDVISVVTGLVSPYGLALESAPVGPIPTLSPWGLFVAALLLLVSGWWLLRRRPTIS